LKATPSNPVLRPDSRRFFHFLVEGRGRLQFFWNVVFSGTSVTDARSHLARYFECEGIDLVGFDEEETKEVDLDALPSEWLEQARPEHHLVAAGGRIWVEPVEPDQSDSDA
jgi:hypothetical protein